MDKQIFTPDRTWENVWIVMRSNKKRKIVLTCKKSKKGVCPKLKAYPSVLSLLSAFLAFCLYHLLYGCFISIVNALVSNGFEDKCKSHISLLFVIPCWLLIVPICILLTFRFLKWVPAG
ncbi:MAG: hypothetical protein IIY94_01940 [Oscillospiraceae bacterium]|nr:hypothetical protein [Oscillospiraceae bacterium]